MIGQGSTPRVVAAPLGAHPPFQLDAVVLEEDTYLVLGSDPVAKATYEQPDGLLRRAVHDSPVRPGTVLVKEGVPLRFLAIVYDLNEEPSCKQEWVAKALEAVLRHAEEEGVRSISLPMLGTRRGCLSPERFAELFRAALEGAALLSLENVFLVVPPRVDPSAIEILLRI